MATEKKSPNQELQEKLSVKKESAWLLLKDKVNSRLEKQSETFKTYIPENYSILKNAVLKKAAFFIIRNSIYQNLKYN